MTFSSPVFMFFFLPLVLALYWAAGSKWRNLFLLFASIIFYMWGDTNGIFLLLSLIIINYYLGIYVAKYREASFAYVFLWLTIGINIGALAWFKYDHIIVRTLNILLKPANLSFSSVELHPVPLGISFFTFTAISYVMDVYREETEPQRNLTHFALFLSMFPKMAAGPIIRYAEIANEISDRKLNLEQFAFGVKRFVYGLGKKVLIADTLAVTADNIFNIPTQELTASVAWLGVVSYTLQIYFDFSGYTDMAIGLGRMFGFKFQENFNYPYISKSLTEFWRRWHISLSTWLRDYLFIPMSHALMTERIRQRISKGNYKIDYRAIFSIVTVFTICGVWHGAGMKYLVWGTLHGIVIAIESTWLTKIMKRWWAPLQHAYFLFIIMFSWVFFRCQTLTDALGYLKATFGFSNNSNLYLNLNIYLNVTFVLALFFGILASFPVLKKIKDYFKMEKYDRVMPIVEVICLAVIIAMSYISLATTTFNPFIYQQF
jgi:alginate O-acetyltransferase complex protein AlgI